VLDEILQFKCGREDCLSHELDETEHPDVRKDLVEELEITCEQCGCVEEKSFICSKQHMTCNLCMMDLLKLKLQKRKTSRLFEYEHYKMKPMSRDAVALGSQY
jgi:hypothetical protein